MHTTRCQTSLQHQHPQPSDCFCSSTGASHHQALSRMTRNDQEGCKKHISSVKISDEGTIYKMHNSQIVCCEKLSKMQQYSFIYYLLLFVKQALAT